MPDLISQVTKSYEAYGEKGVVFYQHLEPLHKAQELLGKLIAQRVMECGNAYLLETTEQFLTSFLQSVFKARIKMETRIKTVNDGNKKDKDFAEQLDTITEDILKGQYKDITMDRYVNIIFKIGLLYDELGYNRAERLRIQTRMQSDLAVPGAETPEIMGMEPAPESFGGE